MHFLTPIIRQVVLQTSSAKAGFATERDIVRNRLSLTK